MGRIWVWRLISIHSPLAGRDVVKQLSNYLLANDFNPLAPRGARPMPFSDCPRRMISIHSPLAGRDQTVPIDQPFDIDFNPLAPRGARPSPPQITSIIPIDFNPLAPRGARPSGRFIWFLMVYNFNPLAPRGARQQKVIKYFLQKPFLLHNTHPYRFENRAYKKKNEVCLGEKRTCIGCEPIWNWVCTGGSHQRISGSSVERTGDTP